MASAELRQPKVFLAALLDAVLLTGQANLSTFTHVVGALKEMNRASACVQQVVHSEQDKLCAGEPPTTLDETRSIQHASNVFV